MLFKESNLSYKSEEQKTFIDSTRISSFTSNWGLFFATLETLVLTSIWKSFQLLLILVWTEVFNV